jgi:hypothetical protein
MTCACGGRLRAQCWLAQVDHRPGVGGGSTIIRIRCRNCDRQWGIPDSEAGKPWRCPACRQEAVVQETAPHKGVPETAPDKAGPPASHTPPVTAMVWDEEPDREPYEITESDLARAEALCRQRAQRRHLASWAERTRLHQGSASDNSRLETPSRRFTRPSEGLSEARIVLSQATHRLGDPK